MIFRQLFDPVSSTYTYLIAERRGGEALLIDPVLEHVQQYIQLIEELGLKLENITLNDLGTAMGEMTRTECVSVHFREGEKLRVDGIGLDVLYTPGHTDDSYSFLLPDRVFTGDTLLIRGTGRTDIQNGDPAAQYDSLFGKLLRLPRETLVYPAHDYNGMTTSTIGEELQWNPRLQVNSRDEYVALMNGLVLDDPRLMDVAVPANRGCGLRQAA